MHCPFCRHPNTQVADSRLAEDGQAIRRRRRCSECGRRFTTFEHAELNLPSIIKKDGHRAEFDRQKLRASLQLALRKRAVSAAALDAALVEIEDQLLNCGNREIQSSQLGQWVMAALRRLDKIAYIRFASVYRNFGDLSDFQQLIQEIRHSSPDDSSDS